MPDILFTGGPTEVVRIAHFVQDKGCTVSLHNPCGPVMDCVSAQVAAALPQLHSLERQYDESPLYEEIVKRAHTIRDGEYLLANVPGNGCTLDDSHPMVKYVATYTMDTISMSSSAHK